MTDASAASLAQATSPGRQFARISGIPVRVTGGAIVLAMWLAFVYHAVLANRIPVLGASSWLAALVFPVGLIGSVLLHEAGHAAVGRRCGLSVRWIVVDGLGGETEFDRDAATPATSALVAGAGPAVSAFLALVLTAGSQLTSSGTILDLFLTQLGVGNALIAAFNLLPGLPLDGGHLLRALLWTWTGSLRAATRVSAVTGLAVAAAIVIVPIALLWSIGGGLNVLVLVILGLVAGPLATGAWSVLREQRAQPPDVPSAWELGRRAVAIHPARSVQEAISQLNARSAVAVIVSHSAGHVVGILTEADLRAVSAADRDLLTLGQLVLPVRAIQLIAPKMAGATLQARVREAGAAVFVVNGGDDREARVLLAADVLSPPVAWGDLTGEAPYSTGRDPGRSALTEVAFADVGRARGSERAVRVRTGTWDIDEAGAVHEAIGHQVSPRQGMTRSML